jgi:hypothetical protein
MERLGRYPLSVVLAFLEEADGVALLSTKKVYYTNLLPMFRIVAPLSGSSANEPDGGALRQRQPPPHRYWFRVVPVPDVTTRLARMNTVRLYRRGRRRMIPMRVGLTTSQQAQIEWREQRRTLVAPFPPHLELLRLKDDDNDCDPTTTTTTSLLPTTTTMRNMHGGGSKMRNPILLLASYPRSGNTLVRSLWEAVTNVITGSDTRPDRPLSQQLNFVGEGHTTTNSSNSSALPFLCKTHWPERQGCCPIVASSVIVLVRNPYDAIDSYWNMNATCTHTETVVDGVYQRYRHFFNRLVQNEIKVWLDYLTYWERQRQDRGVNVLFVRYEDVLRDPAGQVTQMLQFALYRHNSDETIMPDLSEFWQHRIRHAISGKSAGSFGVYRPRTINGTSQSFGKSLKRYSRELLSYIEDTAEQRSSEDTQFLRRFGYSIRHQNFPANFVGSGEPPRQSLVKSRRSTTTIPTITINVDDNNDSMMIRPLDCPFGRNLQAWRHSITDQDRSPLPTVPKPPPPQQTTTP